MGYDFEIVHIDWFAKDHLGNLVDAINTLNLLI